MGAASRIRRGASARGASPPPLLMVFIDLPMMIMFVNAIISTLIIMLRLIMNRFIIISLIVTKGDVECGSMMCPFGLPAKWLRKKE